MSIIHIYGDRGIVLLLNHNQDNKYESCEIEMGVAGPIFTKKTKGYMGQQYSYSTRWEKNIVAIIHIYVDRAIFPLFYYHQDTESKSCSI